MDLNQTFDQQTDENLLRALVKKHDQLENLVLQVAQNVEDIAKLEKLRLEQDKEIKQIQLRLIKKQKKKANEINSTQNKVRTEISIESENNQERKLLESCKKRIKKLHNQMGWKNEEIVIEKKMSKRSNSEMFAVRCPGCLSFLVIETINRGKSIFVQKNYKIHLKGFHSLDGVKKGKVFPKSNLVLNNDRPESLRDVMAIVKKCQWYHAMSGWKHDVGKMRFEDITKKGSKETVAAVTCAKCGKVCSERYRGRFSEYKQHLIEEHSMTFSTTRKF
jgi:ribosomal protein S27E